jgi:hypothetical protein
MTETQTATLEPSDAGTATLEKRTAGTVIDERNELKELVGKSHLWIRLFYGTEQQMEGRFNEIIPRYYAAKKITLDKEDVEYHIHCIDMQGEVRLHFSFYEKIGDGFLMKKFETVGKFIVNEHGEPIYHAERLEQL